LNKPLRVLIDTNVAYTFLSKREDKYAKEAEEIMFLCSSNTIEGYLAIHSLSTMWYLGRKYGEEVRRGVIETACEMFTIVGASQENIIAAIKNYNFKDFEDCLQDKCAKEANCDFIVTANIKDFINSEVPSIAPDELLKIIKNLNSDNYAGD